MTKRDLIEAFLIANLLGSVIFAVLTGLVSGIVLLFRKRIQAWLVKKFAPPSPAPTKPSPREIAVTLISLVDSAPDAVPHEIMDAYRARDWRRVVSLIAPNATAEEKAQMSVAFEAASFSVSDPSRPPSPPPPPA